MRLVSTAALAAALFVMPAAAQTGANTAAKPTAVEADAYVAAVEKEAADLSVPAQQTAWVNATYITDDTDALAARSGAELTEKAVQWAKGAARFNGVSGVSFDTRRKLDLLKNGVGLPAPTTPGAATELATLTTRMSSSYGKGKGTLDGKPINGSDIEAAMGTSRDPAKLKEMWVSWNDNVGAPMRKDYTRMTAISNAGAQELGFA
ncbi:MAG: peptidase M2 family protein, partial [Sphingomonas sp.]